MNPQEPLNADEQRLESWKEIAGYLQRDATTVRRWEKKEGLPVHRHTHQRGSSVYAFPIEIDAWRAGRRMVAEPTPPRSLWKIPAFAVTVLLCLITVGNGVRPVSAQQATAGRAARQVWVTQPGEFPDSVSRDGRYFTLTAWPDLAVHDLTTGATRRLTNDGSGASNESAVFSPDGRQIAYSWSSSAGNEMRLIPVTGGTSRLLRRAEAYMLPLDWSPDGKQLLVSRFLPDGTSQVALISLQDGSIRSLKTLGWQHFNAAFSPDGRWIAYDAPPDPKTQARDIFVLAADGSQEVAAVRNPADDFSPVWSPDGSRILFLSDRTGHRSLWSLSWADGKPGQEELVKADVGGKQLLISQTGTLYYQVPGASGPNIYSAEVGPDMKVSTPPVLLVDTFVNSNNGMTLSPEGTQLAYLSGRQGSVPSLVIRSLKTGEEHVVPSQVPVANRFGTGGPKWFPGGRSVLIMSNVPQGPGPSFYQVDLASGKADLLLHSRTPMLGFSLSPDGKSIFYSEGDRLVRFGIETRQETALQKSRSMYDVSVSPDGTQLAYVDYVGKGLPGSNIVVMPAAGGPAREIFKDPRWDGGTYNSLAWTPDGKYVLFTPNEGGPLRRVPASGGAVESVGASMLRVKNVQFGPDERRIFFVANQSGPNEIWALENFLPKTR